MKRFVRGITVVAPREEHQTATEGGLVLYKAVSFSNATVLGFD
jgi:hypothetical protein